MLEMALAEYAAERRVRPVLCDGCGQDAGLIQPHSEDYSKPWGDHIGKYGLCYTCHMMVHCRFKNPEVWDNYRDAVRGEAIFKPFTGKAFGAFAAVFLNRPLPTPARAREPVLSTLLDEIEAATRVSLA